MRDSGRRTDARKGPHLAPLFPRPYYGRDAGNGLVIVGTGAVRMWGPLWASVVFMDVQECTGVPLHQFNVNMFE